MTTPDETQEALAFLDGPPPVVLDYLLARIEALEARIKALEPKPRQKSVSINTSGIDTAAMDRYITKLLRNAREYESRQRLLRDYRF